MASEGGTQRAAPSLSVVGLGIALASQVTPEALNEIRRADTVFFVLANPVSAKWLRGIRPDAISLHDCYGANKQRHQSYTEMADRIMAALDTGARVCAVFYGHPGVGVDPAYEAMQRSRAAGVPAAMFPGISADASLYCDLGMDPLRTGCQAFEATYFLHRQPRVETSALLLLWQVGIVGVTTNWKAAPGENAAGLDRLSRALLASYPPDHEAILYEAAYYPVCRPVIEHTTIATIGSAHASSIATLVVPPLAAGVSRP